MNTDLKLSLSEARERAKGDFLNYKTKDSIRAVEPHKPGWTPAPDHVVSVNKMVAAPKRDYDAILRAAKRKPVGYWEDAPKGEPFKPAAKPAVAIGLVANGSQPTEQLKTPDLPPFSGRQLECLREEARKAKRRLQTPILKLK